MMPLLFADVIVTVSQWAKEQLERRGAANVVHIRPGIAMPEPTQAAMDHLRHTHDLPAGRDCLVFAGDYEYSGAHPVLLAALPEIVKHNPSVILVFACRTKTPEAVEIEASVRQQVQDAGLLPNVRFLRHVASFDSLLAIASIVLFPVQSLQKKMDIPLTLLQALALRKPLISTNWGPLEELLLPSVGVSVEKGDSKALAAAVGRLLRNPAAMAAMGAAGHDMVQDQYSASQMARAYERLYLSLHHPE
jgi:glycosyltransferase involved in cell wall biosynthesis